MKRDLVTETGSPAQREYKPATIKTTPVFISTVLLELLDLQLLSSPLLLLLQPIIPGIISMSNVNTESSYRKQSLLYLSTNQCAGQGGPCPCSATL